MKCLVPTSLLSAMLLATSSAITVRVLVINYDPVCQEREGKRLHEVCGWADPRVLSQGYIEDLAKSTDGLVQHELVEWRDVDGFPVKTDGFVYDAPGYLRCRKLGKGWHEPDGMDYPRMIEDQKIVPLIDAGKIDEVWLIGPPYIGCWEAAMAGPGAFYINGGVYPKVKGKKPFAIMGFNYERGVAEMLHSLCHRVEASMSRVSGGWKAEELTSDWARFAANARQSNGVAAVGSCHYPPNGQPDYDYANERFVDSDADDWLNYPKLTGHKKPVNRETWGGPDYHRNYLRWWFHRLPRVEGVNADSKLENNWWQYVYQFQDYDENGRAKEN